MPIVRAWAALLCAAAATALAGCATGASAEAPPGVNLAGNWKLDPAASDDPQKVLAQMRAEAYKIINRGPQPTPAPLPRNGQAPRNGSQSQDQTVNEDPLYSPAGPGGQRPDPLRHSPMAHIIMTVIERGDFLTVRQGPEEFVLDFGTSQRSFTPGGHSVVSAEGGVGDQTSGWKNHEYLIQIKAQLGPTVTETLALSGDGKHLVDKLHISSGELPAVNLTRVYDPTTEVAPRQMPNND
jgi:hypothetical protein